MGRVFLTLKEAAVVSEFVYVHVIYNLRNFSNVQLLYYVVRVLESHRYRLSALQVEGGGGGGGEDTKIFPRYFQRFVLKTTGKVPL